MLTCYRGSVSSTQDSLLLPLRLTSTSCAQLSPGLSTKSPPLSSSFSSSFVRSIQFVLSVSHSVASVAALLHFSLFLLFLVLFSSSFDPTICLMCPQLPLLSSAALPLFLGLFSTQSRVRSFGLWRNFEGNGVRVRPPVLRSCAVCNDPPFVSFRI